MFSPAFRSLDSLTARLPFRLNDVDEVNRVFQRWHLRGHSQARRIVELWTYCFIWRYFLVKFTQEATYSVADVEELVDAAYARIAEHRSHLKDPTRYAHWVSVICKNIFLNYLRARRPIISLDAGHGLVLSADNPPQAHDIGFVAQAVVDAIGRLPPYLRRVTYLRMIERRSYEEIARVTGRPTASTRTYVSKGMARLRQDPALRALLDLPDEMPR